MRIKCLKSMIYTHINSAKFEPLVGKRAKPLGQVFKGPQFGESKSRK